MNRGPGAVLMDGAVLLEETVSRVAREIAGAGSPPVCLATVLISDDRRDLSNARRKHTKARDAGMLFRHFQAPADVSQTVVEAAVRELVADPEVHGIFVQLPLPRHLDANAIIDLIGPQKDVDNLTARALGLLMRGELGYAPATPHAITRLLHRYSVPTQEARIVILGRSADLALPLAMLLSHEAVHASVTVADIATPRLRALTREADILISAANKPRMITADYVKRDATVVDAGMSRTESGVIGDVDFEAIRVLAGAIAPMPGGIGPATIACLLENTWTAARRRQASGVATARRI